MEKEPLTELRNRANWVAGWVLAVGLLVMMVAVVDPLNIARTPTNDMGFNARGFTVVGVSLLVSAVGFRLFAVPAIFGVDEVLIVRNPIRQWTIPKHLIEGSDDSLTYLRVHAGGRKIICLGLENSNLSLMTGNSRMDNLLAQANGPRSEAPSAHHHKVEVIGQAVTWTWVRLQRSELCLTGIWVAYIILGAVRQVR